MRPRSSPVWRFFTDIVHDPKHALCKVCKVKVSRGSDNPSKRTTNSLDAHLRSFHAKEWAIVVNLKKQLSISKNGSASTSSMNNGSESTSSMNNGSHESNEIKISQLKSRQEKDDAFAATIPGWIKQTQKVDFHSERGQAFHKSIFEMLIMDLLPFTHVNNLGFQRHHQKFLINFEVRLTIYFRFESFKHGRILFKCRSPLTSTTAAFWSQPIRK